MPNCCQGVPRNSGLIRCSSTQTTNPVKKKKARLAIQRVVDNGRRKIHMLQLASFFTATTIDSPTSVKGIVKDTLFILLTVIVVSPTIASTFCNCHKMLLAIGFFVQKQLQRFKFMTTFSCTRLRRLS